MPIVHEVYIYILAFDFFMEQKPVESTLQDFEGIAHVDQTSPGLLINQVRSMTSHFHHKGKIFSPGRPL